MSHRRMPRRTPPGKSGGLRQFANAHVQKGANRSLSASNVPSLD